MDLLINTFGTRIRSSGERIVLALPNSKVKKEYPIRRIEKIIILRPSSISTNAVQLALEHDVDIVYLGSFGKPVGRILPSVQKGLASLRRAQLDAANGSQSFALAKAFVQGKSLNQIAYLRYLQTLNDISFAEQIIQCETLLQSIDLIPNDKQGRNQLFGVEGYIADKYFRCLRQMYRFPGRKPQGRDKFNSVLNYGYGILYSEMERACLYVGLDPYLGLYHSERYGKPALVLDLVEEFRVPLVDSVLFPLFLEKKFKTSDYVKIGQNQFQLSPEGKHKIVEAVFSRLNQKAHWERKMRTVKDILVMQVQGLSHVFLGKRQQYTPFSIDSVIPPRI